MSSSMGLFTKIEKLTVSVKNIQSGVDIEKCLRETKLCELELELWYEARPEPDYRLIKLLKNLSFYLSNQNSQIVFHKEMLAAIAETLLKTADYDINISEYPDKVRERNDSILNLCAKLQCEEKEPVEEMSDKPYEVTIFMATYNQLELTKLCLESIFQNTGDVSYELYLIDNGSSDGTYEYFKNDNRLKLIRLEENTGLLLALHIFYESGLDNGKFWLYMNNDVVVTPRWVSNMLKCIKSDPKIGSVLPTTNRAAPFVCIQPPFGLYDVESVQSFGERYNISNSNMWQDWLIYYGFVLLMRPSVRRKLGYFEDCFYFPFYYSDGDIILSQIKAGYRAVQARDTYVHHFDGGHTVLQNRRNSLAAGEKRFYKKYGFFPTDIERHLPPNIAAGSSTGATANLYVTSGAAMRILFLGASRSHPLLQLQAITCMMNNGNAKFFAADTMEFLTLEQYGENVPYEQMESWYDVEKVYEGEVFDVVIYLDDIARLRNPAKFLSAVYERLSINGKLYFQADNSGCLLALNYILMSLRSSQRDEVRIRKTNAMSINELIELIGSVGFSVDAIEDVFYNETFTFANLDTTENYRRLCKESMANFKRNMLVPVRNIIVRKPGDVNIENTLEQLLYEKKGVG